MFIFCVSSNNSHWLQLDPNYRAFSTNANNLQVISVGRRDYGYTVEAEKCRPQLCRAAFRYRDSLWTHVVPHIIRYHFKSTVLLCVLPPLPYDNHLLTPPSCDYLAPLLRPQHEGFRFVQLCSGYKDSRSPVSYSLYFLLQKALQTISDFKVLRPT